MSSYEELGKYYGNARSMYFKNKQTCRSFANHLFTRIKSQLQIPDGNIVSCKVNGEEDIVKKNDYWFFKIKIVVEISKGNVEPDDNVYFECKVKFKDNIYKLFIGEKEFDIDDKLTNINNAVNYFDKTLYDIYKDDNIYFEFEDQPTDRTLKTTFD